MPFLYIVNKHIENNRTIDKEMFLKYHRVNLIMAWVCQNNTVDFVIPWDPYAHKHTNKTMESRYGMCWHYVHLTHFDPIPENNKIKRSTKTKTASNHKQKQTRWQSVTQEIMTTLYSCPSHCSRGSSSHQLTTINFSCFAQWVSTTVYSLGSSMLPRTSL